VSSSAKAPPVYLHCVGLAPAVQVSARISIPAETPRTYYCALRWQGGHVGLRLGAEACDRQAIFCVWDVPDGQALSEEHALAVGSDRMTDVPSAVIHHAAFSWEHDGVYEFILESEHCAGRTFISASITEMLTSGESCPSLLLGTVSLPGRHLFSELGSHLQDVTPSAEMPAGRIPVRRMSVGHIASWSDDQGHVCRQAAWSSVGGAASDGPVNAFSRADWFWLESGTGVHPTHRPDETITAERPRAVRAETVGHVAAAETPPFRP
jgi:hypothetical protein